MKLSTIVPAVVAIAATFAPALTHAQSVPPPMDGPPPPADAIAPNGQYVTPMRQVTQETYVPQSVAMSGPRLIQDWHEGEGVPPGYHASSRVRSGMIAGGMSMFGAAYLLSLITASINNDINRSKSDGNPAWPLYIPVLGPFITLGNVQSATEQVFLVINGLMQAGGVALTVAGIAWPKVVLVRNDLGKVEIRPTPLVAKDMGGVGLTGTF